MKKLLVLKHFLSIEASFDWNVLINGPQTRECMRNRPNLRNETVSINSFLLNSWTEMFSLFGQMDMASDVETKKVFISLVGTKKKELLEIIELIGNC